MSVRLAELPLAGPAGEPVDLRRTIVSHGLADLPPMRTDEEAWTLEVTLPVDGRGARTITIREARPGSASIEATGRKPGVREAAEVVARARWILRLDDDLSAFYERAAGDPALAWATGGAGRLVRSPTVFEEVVKTICTTNCSWSATERMVGAIVEHLGIQATGAPPTGPWGRAFPDAAAMAAVGEDFYRDVARAGYRGRYLRELAASVAEGSLDLEELATAPAEDVSDDEVEHRLLALPGVGPYAAAHVMLLLGRTSRCVLDSWSRPKYASVIGRRSVSDAAIVRRFRRYGPYAARLDPRLAPLHLKRPDRTYRFDQGHPSPLPRSPPSAAPHVIGSPPGRFRRHRVGVDEDCTGEPAARPRPRSRWSCS